MRLDGAERCIAAPDLARAVEARLGRPVFLPPSQADLAVEGRAEPVRDGGAAHWRAVLRLADAGGASLGERVVESRSPDCDELGRVVTVALALMIDPPGAEAAPEPAPAPDPAPVPAPGPAPAPPPAWRVGIDTSLAVGAGAVPGVGVGGRLFVRVRPPGFVPVYAAGELIPFSRTADAAAPTDLGRAVGALSVCPLVLAPGAVTVDGCLGVGAGVLFVEAAGAPLNATEWVLVEAQAALHVRWTVTGPLVLRAGLHPSVPLRRVGFVGQDDTPVFEPAPVSFAADAGVGVTW